MRKNSAVEVAKFLYQNIMTRTGCPSDQGTHFLNKVIQELTKHHMIIHKKSSVYHPQCNGQAESSNKILVKTLKKTVQAHKRDCDKKLDSALWALQGKHRNDTLQVGLWVGSCSTNGVHGPKPNVAVEDRLPMEESQEKRIHEPMTLDEEKQNSILVAETI